MIKLKYTIGIIEEMRENVFPAEDPANDMPRELITSLLNLTENAYIPIPFPEVQDYMEEDWFDEEAILDVECKFGSSAYFIPLKRLI